MSDEQKRLERRVSGVKQSVNEIRREQDALREDIAELQETVVMMEDQLHRIEDQLNSYSEQFRQIQVNKEAIGELDAALQGKVGNSAFEQLEERVSQARARLDFLSAALDTQDS